MKIHALRCQGKLDYLHISMNTDLGVYSHISDIMNI